MQRTQPAEAWDALVARTLARASTTTSTRGLRSLAVRTDPTCSARPELRRDLAAVSPELRAVVRDLVTGAAPWPLYVWGPAGTGKTSAALVLLDHCGPVPRDDLEHDTPARLRNWLAGYADVRALPGIKIDCDKGRLQWAGGGPAMWDRLLAAAARVPLFVLDEIAVGGEQGDFRLDTLLEVIDVRAGDPVRPFVVTGNAKPGDLARLYDDRIADRVLAGTVLKLDGASRRTGR